MLTDELEENVFGFEAAGKAGNGDGPRVVFDGEAKSPKSNVLGGQIQHHS